MRSHRHPATVHFAAIALIAAAALLIGCAEAARERLGLGTAPPTSVAMIVHGAEADPFWTEVLAGAEDAARAFDVNLFWRSTPDSAERIRLINETVQQGFDVLVVTLSDPEALADVVRDAVLIGVTVYVINVGAEAGVELGAATYFGQVETIAGLAVGDRLVEAGGTHLLCVQHEANNVALETRCQRAGSRVGRVTSLQVAPDENVEALIEAALIGDPSIDALLTMTTAVMESASTALDIVRQQEPEDRTIVHGVFELNDVVLNAIEDGRVAFAVDQQPYLQGYLPIAYARLTQYSERTQGDELADALLQWIAGRGILLGPGFVDATNVARVREALSRIAAE